MILKHEFVEFIPENISDGIIYISITYRTAVHNCVCGCKNKVVTRFSPTNWQFTFDGVSISLYPSIGNWSFKCKSHYWITKNTIKKAELWSDEEIEDNRKNSIKNEERYMKKKIKWQKDSEEI